MNYNQVCDHIIVNSTCTKCGLYIENAFDIQSENIRNCSRYYQGKTSILDNLKDYPPEVIKKTRQNISRKQGESGKKIRNDAKNTFIQLYEAFLDCGYSDFDPYKVSKDLNLSRKDVNLCLKILSGTSLVPSIHEESNFASIVIISPLSYIKDICERNNINEHYEQLTIITKHILKNKDILYSSKPEYVSCAIVKKYCEKKGIFTKTFSKNNNISDNALKKTMIDIEEFF